MAEVAAILFMILGIAYIAYPFFTGTAESETYFEAKVDSELLLRKENLLKGIKEIEFDLKMGKISEADYREMKGRFREELISIYRELDKKKGKEGTSSPDDEIEREIRAIRKKKG